MKYFGQENTATLAEPGVGVLLVNLGTPEKPVCPGLRSYLSEFLQDPRVIELPRFFRWLLVKGIIINFRAHKSARNYRKIWTEEGSPLLVNTQNLASHTDRLLEGAAKVDFAMRYGQPSVASKLKSFYELGIREVVIIPLYPQYSGSTTGSAFDAVADTLKQFRWVPKLHFVDAYHENPLWIEAIASSVREHWQTHGQADKLIMSFHGVPKKYSERGDPYEQQCRHSAQAIATALGLNEEQWMLVFQSRFGAEEWLQPYCDKTLEALPAQGVNSVDLICPGFSADCLETLEEIDQENRDIFLSHGGSTFNYIPCLNAQESHAMLMADIARKVAQL